MQSERYGTRYEKTCPVCNRVFGTDNKIVKYCSMACYRKAEAEKEREFLKTYYQREDVKRKRKEYDKRMRMEKKKTKLASNISAYFLVLHDKGVNPPVLSKKPKRG